MQSNLNTFILAGKTEKKVFSSRELSIVLNYKGSVRNRNIWIKRLKDRGLILPIKKGVYALANGEISKFEYSNILYVPSYISLDSALNYYGMLPQVPLNIKAVTLKRAKFVDHNGVGYEYFHINPAYYWGYENINNILIATKEKSLVDKVYFEAFQGNVQAGFMDELTLEDVSKERLFSYASKIQNKAFNKLMETLYVKF